MTVTNKLSKVDQFKAEAEVKKFVTKDIVTRIYEANSECLLYKEPENLRPLLD